jgi:hypothetical protein
VVRPAGWWTPAVHALLAYLESVGFAAAPRVRGTDGLPTEILTYIEGRSGKDAWAEVADDAGLARFARLLRAYHDAVAGFRPPAGAVWMTSREELQPGQVVCHGDFGPWNVVWRDGRPVGILDWDCAGPGLAIDDVAYAIEYTAPFRDDDTCVRWLAYEQPPDRRRRIATFAEAYGLETTEGLVDHVIRVQRAGIDRVRMVAARSLEPQSGWVAEGHLDELAARAAWSERNRALFE